MGDCDGFDEEIVGAFVGVLHEILLFVFGDHDHGDGGSDLLEELERLEAGLAGHILVEEDEVERVGGEGGYSVVAVGGGGEVVAVEFEGHDLRFEGVDLVVDPEDFLVGHSGCFMWLDAVVVFHEVEEGLVDALDCDETEVGGGEHVDAWYGGVGEILPERLFAESVEVLLGFFAVAERGYHDGLDAAVEGGRGDVVVGEDIVGEVVVGDGEESVVAFAVVDEAEYDVSGVGLVDVVDDARGGGGVGAGGGGLER